MNKEINITIAGAAGQGLVTVSNLLLRVLAGTGLHLFARQDYMSRVRGGHNFMRIRAADHPIHSAPETASVLIALNAESVEKHRQDMEDPGYILYDPEAVKTGLKKTDGAIEIPLKEIARDIGGALYENSVALGALLALIGMDLEEAFPAVERRFAAKGEKVVQANKDAFRAGYDHYCENYPAGGLPKLKTSKKNNMLLNGAQAFGLGLMAGGLRFISAYPMSPSTAIFQYITDRAAKAEIISEQAEDEIAAVNAAIGASAMGARSAVTTSGGGMALMAEGISLAGVMETPVVIADIQRPGPATGLPTRTGQEDLEFALSIGHGEFPRFIFAPGHAGQAFYTAVNASNLADKYQVPAILLGDQHLTDSYTTPPGLNLKKYKQKEYRATAKQAGNGYKRYKLTKNGVSPRAFYGDVPDGFMTDSHVHKENGRITEDAALSARMAEKRFAKVEGMKKEFGAPEWYGPKNAATVLVCWGSTYGAVREAVDLMNADKRRGSAAMLHFNRIWPFPLDETKEHLKGKKRTLINVENNYQGQFGRLLYRETGYQCKTAVLRYDGRPINPDYIMQSLKGGN